jgi:cell fate regulator YaaT (PSP1 superfamily)
MLKKKVQADSPEIKGIYRIATQKDLDKYAESRNKELPTLFRTRQLLEDFKLNMKMSDVEFQADCSKATFYYSADDRIDFRELIKSLAGEFKVRVEMRQISLRQEAGRIGGIGSCGRELCCSTWLTDFKNVTTGAARYQNLSLNPAKLSGQCGRLKCCLNFELETYLDALKGIPNIDQPLQTEKGDAYLQKTDIFRRIMWFGYKGESTWHPLPIDRVNQVLALNKAGEKAKALTEKEEVEIEQALNPQPINDDLKRMDKKMLDRDRAIKKKKQDLKQKQGGNNRPPLATDSFNNTKTESTAKPKQNQNVRPERKPENRPNNNTERENKLNL